MDGGQPGTARAGKAMGSTGDSPWSAVINCLSLSVLLPHAVREKLALAAAYSMALVLKKERELIRANIRSAFPGEEEDWVSRVARKNIAYQGKFIAEFFDISGRFPREPDRLMKSYPSKSEIIRMTAEGGIVILGHLGNWEWTGRAISRWMPGRIYALAEKPSDPRSAKLVADLRNRDGIRTVYAGEGMYRYKKILSEGMLLCMLADQDAGKHGRFFRFMGRPASTHMGPAVLARVTGCRVFFASSWHEGKKIGFRIESLKIPAADPVRDPREWERQLTANWVHLLEKSVEEHPEEYLWSHDRWKTRPSTGGKAVFEVEF
jgi:KDO2-lipid IV(A) lauroyltransferase